MQTKLEDIGRLRPYENNPRDNTGAIEPVAESIRTFGFLQPIVADSDGVIIAGHTRYEAAQLLGLKQVPVVYADLDEEAAAAYRLADNKTAEMSKWDASLLADELEAIEEINMGAFGFVDAATTEQQETPEPQSGLLDLITVPFIFSIEDCELVEECLRSAPKPKETHGNTATKGNKLTEVCAQWEARRISK